MMGMTFLVTLDLYSVLLVCIIPPVIVFLCVTAYYCGKAMKPLFENKYVSKIIKENNETWKEYLKLQQKLMEMEDHE